MIRETSRFARAVRLSLILLLGLQLVVHPQTSSAAPNPAAASPAQAQATGLIRGQTEALDPYLQRVAATDPDLFQEAALLAVQDVFNGTLPEVAGDKAIEEQISYYLNRVALGLPMQPSVNDPAVSSALQADAYLWENNQAAIGATWQMTARPDTDPQAFAQEFDALAAAQMPAVAVNAARIETPALTVVDPALDPAETVLVPALPSSPARPKARLVEPSSPAMTQFLASLPSQQAEADFSGLRIQPQVALNNPVQTPSAKLAITATAPLATSFDELITYTVTISNTGGQAASAVEMTQRLPANGIFQAPVSGCLLKDVDQVICTVGNLNVNQTKTYEIPVKMKGNGILTSTLTVKDSLIVNPDTKLASIKVTTAVTSTKRTQQEVGKIVIAAEEFTSFFGETEASGAVEIGFKKNGKYTYHLRLGPDDKIKWDAVGTPTIVTTYGSVSQIEENFPLFKGDFEIDVSKDKPFITPSPTITPTIKHLAGFQLLGSAVISDVAILSGEAGFMTELKVSLPGITTTSNLTPTTKITTTTLLQPSSILTGTNPVSGTAKQNTLRVTGVIKPGGKGEAKINEFEMFFAGLKVKVKDATFSGDKIKVKQALLTMPKQLGELTGIVAQIEVTSKSITFGGVGVKIPLPNIYPFGKPTTSTNPLSSTSLLAQTAALSQTGAYTPAIAFIKNSATIMYDSKEGFSLQIDSTLDLHVASNDRKIPVELKIDWQGNVKGTIKKLELKIAGHDLEMKDVVISNSGLKVDEASFTITFPSEKKQEPNASARGAAIESDKKKEDKKLTITVKKVSITKNGFAIGEGAIASDLPDFGLGDSIRFTKNKVKFVVTNPITDPAMELELEGTLKVLIKSSEMETKFSAKWDKKGKFSGKLKELTLTVASSKLELKNVEFNTQRFSTNSASLTLPAFLGSTKIILTKVVIDENGLSFGDAAVKIPVKFTIGKENGEPSPTNSVTISGTLGLDFKQDKSYSFVFAGKVSITLASQTAEAEGMVQIDKDGKVTGSVDSFELTIAGMKLAIKEANIENGTIKAREATFAIPKEWGGLSVSVYNIEISKEGFSIGGGSFKLPEIKVGDMSLSLEGTLKKEGNGWIIAAGGELKLPNASGAGCSGLGVSVEIFAGSNQTVAMRIVPASAEAINAFQLRKVGVVLKCTIPLGTSGFDLTRIEGTVTLTSNVTKIEMKATIESKMGIGSFRAVTADGNMSMEYVKNPYKFEIGIGASMKIFSMFEAARASAKMRFTDGAVPFLFTAEMNINAVIARGNMKLTAWTKDGAFNLVGRIYGEVGVKRGALVDSCWRVWLPFRTREVCLRIPSDDFFIGAGMEFGKFKRGNGDTWGFKASVNIAGANYGIYVDTNGRFSVGNVDDYRLIDAPSLRRAQYLHDLNAKQQLNRASLSAEDAALFNDYSFNNQEIIISTVEMTRPGDLMLTMLRSVSDSDLQVSLVRPDGLRITGSNPSGNVTFNEVFVDPRDIRDPITQAPDLTAPPMIQTSLNVTNAELGQWKLVLQRAPAFDFIINVSGTVYGPPIEKLAVSNQNDSNNLVDLAWMQSTPYTATATIYASQDTITDTASYTKTNNFLRADGIMATETITVDVGTVTKFGGYPLASFDYAEGSQNASETLDLSSLKSGVYNLWLEVNDGQNPPSRQYFPNTVSVLHELQPTWTSTTVITPGYGSLDIAWEPHPNPDIDGYEIHVRSQNDQFDEDLAIIDVGDAGTQIVTGLAGGEAYDVMIVGYDSGTGRTSESSFVAATPLVAPFSMSANPSGLTLDAGVAGTSNLTIASSVNPYPEQVFLEIAELPEGFAAQINTPILTPTLVGVQSSVVLTPAASLLGGTYTVTLVALSNGSERYLSIPVTVREPDFSLRTSVDNLTLTNFNSTSVEIDATYQFSERDEIFVDVVDMPVGVDWSFTRSSFMPGEKTRLILTDTLDLEYGDYPITLLAFDNEHAYTKTLNLAVTGFYIEVVEDQAARPHEVGAPYVLTIDGNDWNQPIELTIEEKADQPLFFASLSSATAEVGQLVNLQLSPLIDTAPGSYEVLVHAASAGYTQTIPLYITVQANELTTDVAMGYEGLTEGYVVAGESYSYILAPKNISLNPARDVIVTERMLNNTLVTLADADGCGVATNGTTTSLSCNLGDIPAGSQNSAKTLTWQVKPDVAEGTLISHTSELLVNDTTISETSAIDNRGEVAFTVERLSDLDLTVDYADVVNAGELAIFTATVTNLGPSVAAETLVEFYLPAGTSLHTASVGCVQEAELVSCQLGSLLVGQVATVAVTLKINPDQREYLETLVAVDSDSYDEDLNNNAVYTFAEVAAVADLAVTIVPNRSAINEGEAVEYLVTIINQGSATANNLQIELDLPAEADIVDLRIGNVLEIPEELMLAPGASLTATIGILYPEDDAGTPISIQATALADEASAVTATSANLSVANLAPTGLFTNTMVVNEGEFGVLAVMIDDAGTSYDPLSVAWDLDNDGAFDDSNTAITRFDARSIDGTTTRPVAVKILDDDGGETILNRTVIVRNVAPMVAAGPDQFQIYNEQFTLDLALSDPFANDSKTASIDWGDGVIDTLPLAAQVTAASANHTYATIGNYATKVCVTDDNQGRGCDEVVLYAMCRDNGLLVRVVQQNTQISIILENASGNVAISAGMPLTLYHGNTVLQSFVLDQPLAVGASRTLNYTWADAPLSATLRVATDDNGTGTKSTDFCSGSVYKWAINTTIYAPVIMVNR
ncbi:PKD domain-containing protein [Herpetosiphon geysericola]|uniref:Fibronectin type-III domain-containing protein n=1 Tax=Herpetosiphon geysericola TaxID=70996 RepID=A0A0P6YM50_9CHLR|nr:PKD domain-containing protein [Herpetosiphon geysericola]KPL91703.1 hypothetical protein SE18_01595 [Herpetosiphon geysericola]